MKLLKTFNAVAGLAAILTLSGCGSSYLTPRNENPIVKDSVGNGIFDSDAQFAAFGMDASRRMVFFKLKNDLTKFCSEPSPDAAVELAKKLAASASASVQGSGEGRLSVDSEMASKMPMLLSRSQGVQLFRDGNFFSCQDFVNNAIDSQTLNDRFNKLLDTATDLIKIELNRPVLAPVRPAP